MSAAPERDTIAAVATAPGVGGVGIVRISGPRVPEIARLVRLSERQVWSVLGREPGDERQMSLF